ncbi:MAG: peptidase U34 [Clostridiales bacterium]|nr:peptidase U34 [Clostridiales bacterium]
MCDTLWKKINGEIFFAKNSDRSCNEPNLTVFIKGGKRKEESVKCTYISIPQVERVNSVLLVKPSWIWGAEMGINEHGLTIGNEAVFTKSKGKKEKKLLGMDMLRLALERAQTAKQAKEVILELLATYGQGGNCGYDKNFYYDNSFLITDHNQGFIIETAGKDYIVKELNECGNISNRLSTDSQFAKKHTEPIFTHFSGSKERLRLGAEKMHKANNLKDVFNVLRAHTENDDKKLFTKGSVKSVCMHQSLLGDHTTGSMVVHYGKTISIWITGSSAPCLSIFKPVVFGLSVPPVFLSQENSLDYWRKRERLNRAIFSGYIDASSHRRKLHSLEDEFIAKYCDAISNGEDADKLNAICLQCSQKEEEFINEYKDILDTIESGDLKFAGRWKKLSKNL